MTRRSCCAPGASPEAARAAAANPARATVAESLGTIEKRDLLRLRIVGIKPPPGIAEKWARVDDDGAVGLPHLGARKLAGMTTAQAEEAIAKLTSEDRNRALFERDDDREPGPHMLNRSFSGTY